MVLLSVTDMTPMPPIYIIAADGTRYVIPERAVAFSGLLRGALDEWCSTHAPPSPTQVGSEEHAEDDVDSEATPEGLQDYYDGCSSRTRSDATFPVEEPLWARRLGDFTDDEESDNKAPMQGLHARRKTDGAASTECTHSDASTALSDDDDRTPSISEASSQGTPGKTANGNLPGPGPKLSPHTTSHNCYRSDASTGKLESDNAHEGVNAYASRDDSATPSSLEEGGGSGTITPDLLGASPTPIPVIQTVSDEASMPGGTEHSIFPELLLKRETGVSLPSGNDAEVEEAYRATSGCSEVVCVLGESSGVVQVSPPNCSPRVCNGSHSSVCRAGGTHRIIRGPGSSTAVVAVAHDVSSDGDENEADMFCPYIEGNLSSSMHLSHANRSAGGQSSSDKIPSPGPDCPTLIHDQTPTTGRSDAWSSSPASYHERTICVIGGDTTEEVCMYTGDGQEHRIRTPLVDRSPLAAVSTPIESDTTFAVPAVVGVDRQGAWLDQSRDDAPCAQQGVPGEETSAALPVSCPKNVSHFYGARISADEITVCLDVLPSSAEDKTDNGRHACTTSPTNTGESSLAQNGERAGSSPVMLSSAVVKLCAEYLTHFAEASLAPILDADQREDIPTPLPQPLPAPLVCLLHSWETDFLYRGILNTSDAAIEAVQQIHTLCPKFSFLQPGDYLQRDAQLARALLVPPPAPEAISRLLEVRHAAVQLQISSLHALCTAWMSDFMIRVCYGASNNFDAAHLIRQCFGVQNDWTKKELDCLKIENEWPANEEA